MDQLVELTYGPDFLDSTHGPNLWSPKNKELSRIGLVDCPRMGGVQLMDRPKVELEK